MAHTMADYEQAVAPHKHDLFAGIGGRILELGAGTGPNAVYYPPGSTWIALEPNPYMYPYLKQAAQTHGLHLELAAGRAEAIPLADASVDAVVSTLVLCSVSNPSQVLQEVLRVLKPGGTFHFLEHVAAPTQTRLWHWQKRLKPLWRCLADGCCPDRETGRSVEQAGFASVNYTAFEAPLPALVRPQLVGRAHKAALA
ncbi:MAG: class I SAM-dependent methyltransferase [Gloeomargaritaceae cyanobacterium C42_A2020_066]|nr:class I SAM-dependent methyltransferase [Gloeomargaritaceae cyanobacterium C42_A2020_066]